MADAPIIMLTIHGNNTVKTIWFGKKTSSSLAAITPSKPYGSGKKNAVKTICE
jgi:hypothetical protein